MQSGTNRRNATAQHLLGDRPFLRRQCLHRRIAMDVTGVQPAGLGLRRILPGAGFAWTGRASPVLLGRSRAPVGAAGRTRSGSSPVRRVTRVRAGAGGPSLSLAACSRGVSAPERGSRRLRRPSGSLTPRPPGRAARAFGSIWAFRAIRAIRASGAGPSVRAPHEVGGDTRRIRSGRTKYFYALRLAPPVHLGRGYGDDLDSLELEVRLGSQNVARLSAVVEYRTVEEPLRLTRPATLHVHDPSRANW